MSVSIEHRLDVVPKVPIRHSCNGTILFPGSRVLTPGQMAGHGQTHTHTLVRTQLVLYLSKTDSEGRNKAQESSKISM